MSVCVSRDVFRSGAQKLLNEVVRGPRERAKAAFVHLRQPELDLPQPPDGALVHESPTNDGEPVHHLHVPPERVPGPTQGSHDAPACAAAPHLPRWLAEARATTVPIGTSNPLVRSRNTPASSYGRAFSTRMMAVQSAPSPPPVGRTGGGGHWSERMKHFGFIPSLPPPRPTQRAGWGRQCM